MIYEIDALGLLCPLPVLKLRKHLNACLSGDEVHILADDPVAVIDIPHFCKQTGHIFVSAEKLSNDATKYIIRAK